MPNKPPKIPGLVTVNVEPKISSATKELERAFLAYKSIFLDKPR